MGYENHLYIISNPKQPSYNKCAAPKKAIVKKTWNPRLQPRNGCDDRLMAKVLITQSR